MITTCLILEIPVSGDAPWPAATPAPASWAGAEAGVLGAGGPARNALGRTTARITRTASATAPARTVRRRPFHGSFTLGLLPEHVVAEGGDRGIAGQPEAGEEVEIFDGSQQAVVVVS